MKLLWTLKTWRQKKTVKHTQKNLSAMANEFLDVFDHFSGSGLKGLGIIILDFKLFGSTWSCFETFWIICLSAFFHLENLSWNLAVKDLVGNILRKLEVKIGPS